MIALPGTTYGTLTVVGEASRLSVKRRVNVRCQCGRERSVQVSNLASGGTRSCGYYPCVDRNVNKRLAPGEQAATVIYLNYRASGREFTLTREQFDTLTAMPCHYCGTPPSNRTRDRNGDGAFVYSGLDRVDSTGGYTIGNVVPACVVCNRAKTDMTLEAFYEWIEAIWQRRFTTH